ncbi:MAG: hypothetical protein ABFC65_03100 [Rectinema sp.]
MKREVTTLSEVCKKTDLSFPSVIKGKDVLIDQEIVREITGAQRNRIFAYDRYLSILNEGTEPA